MTFRLAPMSPSILVLTGVLLALPLAFLEVTWPLRRREIPRDDISAVRVIDRQTLRREAGWGVRVGAGGFFGGFGYLWTTNRGLVRMYVSRTDRFVWIERKSDRPWLITPDQPDAFVRAMAARG
jgi:hypothetical protein